VRGGRLSNGIEQILPTKLHFSFESLFDHAIPQPTRKKRASLNGPFEFTGWRAKNLAEVNGYAREKSLFIAIGRERQSTRSANVRRDNFGVSFEKKKPGSIEQFHEATRPRKAAFREKHETPPGLKIFGHPLHGVRRIRIDRKTVLIEHQHAMQPTGLRGNTRSDKPPGVIEKQNQEQPI